VLWGVPGDWYFLTPTYTDHVGRFNSLWVSGDTAVLATLIDRLDSELKPDPGIGLLSFDLTP